MYDYIIIGQGLAGSILGYTMLQADKKILMINDEQYSCTSKVAAGIYNPVTGKRVVKTWKYHLLFPFLIKFYKDLEEALKIKIIYDMPVYKPFSSIYEQNTVLSNDDLSLFNINIPSYKYEEFVYNEFNGFETFNSGYVDVKKLLVSIRSYFEKVEVIKSCNFNYNDLSINSLGVEWKGIKSKKIIFCEGSHAIQNPFFNYLPFQLSKGQLLNIHFEHFPTQVIFNKSVFILPISGFYKCGATYEWAFENADTTEEAATFIVSKAKELVKYKFSILSQEAGIRPTVKDRRPLIGLHPKFNALGIFNGLGTKGVSLAPYFAKEYFDFLEGKKELDREVNIQRYISLLLN